MEKEVPMADVQGWTVGLEKTHAVEALTMVEVKKARKGEVLITNVQRPGL